MRESSWVKTKYDYIFGMIALVVLVSVFTAVSITLAWLRYMESIDNTETPSNIGIVDFKVYKDSDEITINNGVYTIPCTGTGYLKSAGLKIYNTGTIDALIRFEMNIYYINGSNQKISLLSSDIDSIVMDSNLIDTFPTVGVSIYSGAVYYNRQIVPYVIEGQNVASNILNVLESFTLRDSSVLVDKTFFVDITNVSMIAYSGNIYKKISQYTLDGEDWTNPTDMANIMGRIPNAEMPDEGKNAFAYVDIATLPTGFDAYKVDNKDRA